MPAPSPSPDEKPAPEHALRRLLLPPLVFTLGLGGLLLVLQATGVLAVLYDRPALRAWVQGTGAWAPLALLAVLAVRPFTLFPGTLLVPVVAELFGVALGAALTVLGSAIGATLAFLAMRHGLGGLVSRGVRRLLPGLSRSMDGGLASRLGALLERRGLLAVLALRVNLLLPFDALNYGLALTPVKTWAFVLGTLAGIVPGTLAYVALSGAALEGDWRQAALIVAGIVAMLLLSVPLARDLLASRRAAVNGPE
jgi:uncharacterized membrane protein YdjX (TVP38/TMEM64 family)